MQISKILTLVLMAVVLLMNAGCNDEEVACAPCPFPPPAWTNGNFQLFPAANLYLEIYANGGLNPNIDSVRIGDSTCYDIVADYWEGNESNPFFYVEFSEDNHPDLMYESGDTAVIQIWGSAGNGRWSACRLVALDYYVDVAEMLIPDDNDTTLLYGQDCRIYWAKNEHAEWYGVELDFQLDSSGTTIFRDRYTYSLDTTFTIPDTMYGMPVEHVSAYVLPTTGPWPGSTVGNWTGDLTTGKLYSIGDYASAFIWFENGPAVTARHDTRIKHPKSAREIIEAIYRASE